jgi:hypothetical protein
MNPSSISLSSIFFFFGEKIVLMLVLEVFKVECLQSEAARDQPKAFFQLPDEPFFYE